MGMPVKMGNYDIELGTQVFSNFIFSNMYTADLPLNVKAHYNVKLAAFKIVQDMYQHSYNCALDPLLALRESDDDVALPRDKCLHYLIADIKNVIDVLEHINSQPKYQYNIYVFLPYVKQIRLINNMFLEDFCCSSIVKTNATAIKNLCDQGEKYLQVIKLMNERMHLINVFTEPKVYQCNICQETSAEEHFLKPNECCGYSMCNMCYANLWKFCNMYPVCPVCKTSFKTSKRMLDEQERI
ncbi:ie-0 [Agrotis segetum nucleopolyhedrovirus B]|uniref:Ie-0 n=1 Tax=Agrotis segetum nucleopolyhedrovirus B TaxID=1580580 RepID=A0A0A7KTK8_9ABAC|nr:ie-0 [Agrotis segetum nucleopolyhedrovirus B]AIZ48706.1 ie-0 [Agrotis segetum nucleopolyhedrovirus B]